jgi:hypothetical protein
MIYVENISPNLFHWVIVVLHGILRMKIFIFDTGFFKDYNSTLIFSTWFLRSFDTKDTYVQMHRGSVIKYCIHLKGHLFVKTLLRGGKY